MKKVIVLLGTVAVTASLWAQGTVDFKNSTTTLVKNSATGTNVIGGTTFRVALYYLPDQAAAPAADQFVIQLGANTGFAGTAATRSGFFQGGNRDTPVTTAPGEFAWFQVRAWEFAFGSTFEAALASGQGLAGMSAPFRMQTVNTQKSPPDTPFNLAQGGFQSFWITPVPEPSAIGLGVLGIGALWLLRRRK